MPKALAGDSNSVMVEYAYASMAWDVHCAFKDMTVKGIRSINIICTKSYRMNDLNSTLLWNKVTRTVLILHVTQAAADAFLEEYGRPQDVISSVHNTDDQTCVVEMISMIAAQKLHQLVQIDAAFVTDPKQRKGREGLKGAE